MKMEDFLLRPEIQYRPEIRWWLAEGFHTDRTLKQSINELCDLGFGAVEFVAMEEPGADSSVYGWGSEEWMHDSGLIADEATKRGMGVSMTSGTNWANANLPSITPDDRAASKELDYESEIVKAGHSRSGKIRRPPLRMTGVTGQILEAVVAVRFIRKKDDVIILDKEKIYVLTKKVKKEELSWQAPEDGDYVLFFFWLHGTGQTAGPSVGTSYAVNYIDMYGIEAFKDYWEKNVFTSEFLKGIGNNDRVMMYMDSLELSTFGNGGQLWGYHFKEEFQKRRNYDITPYLPFIIKESGQLLPYYVYPYTCEDEVFIEKLLNDLYQTMTDLYMENILKPMQEWLHSHHISLRAEISYGMPFEISQPGKYVDGIETESLEFASQIECYRNLAGPAHVYNKMYSSETGATSLNYMMGLDFYTQIIYTQFAAGVKKTVLHGFASIAGTEEATVWSGHEGMRPCFSERFGNRQPSSRHYPEWTDMIARFQKLLRKAPSKIDLAILRTDYNFNNVWHHIVEEEAAYRTELMRGNQGIYWRNMELQNAGYTWDYFSPSLLEENFADYDGSLLPEGPAYQAVIIYQEMLSVSAAEKILFLARKGMPVIFVNGADEMLRPFVPLKHHQKAASKTPFNDKKEKQLCVLVNQIKQLPNVKEIDNQADAVKVLLDLGIRPRLEFCENNTKILTHLCEDSEKKYIFVYNMMYGEHEPYSFGLRIKGKGIPYRVDCWSGEITGIGCYTVKNGCTALSLRLAPGEAKMYILDKAEKNRLHAIKTDAAEIEATNERLIAYCGKSGTFSVEFSDGSKKTFSVTVPESIRLPVWHLEVEDWNEGEKHTIIEDRGKGILTREVYYETKKSVIDVGETELKSWKDIECIGPSVSGIGYYTVHVFLDDWDDSQAAFLRFGSTNGHSCVVYVNGIKAGSMDMNALTLELSKYLRSGDNIITAEVATSLNNRLLSRGYYKKAGEISERLRKKATNAVNRSPGLAKARQKERNLFEMKEEIRDYGITGTAELIRYKKVEL